MQQQKNKQEVLAAIRQLAASINSGRKGDAEMASLVDATSRLSLSNLGAWERLIRWGYRSALAASAPPKWKIWVRPASPVTWIDLCSGDGYKREKSLRTLSGAAPNSFFFAVAVRCLNDWVPQVREAAREKLLLIAKQTNPEHVVDVLCATLPHWNSWGRLNETDKQALLAIVSLEEVAHFLKLRIISATSGPMSSILAQAGRSEALDTYLNEIAKEAIQPAVRAKAYRSLLEGKMVSLEGRKWEWTNIRYCEERLKPIFSERILSVSVPLLETLKLAAIDRSPMVRRVAGDVLIQRLSAIGNESAQLAELLASDSSPSVVERGSFALKKLENLGK
jgi:hypothetical protein